MLQARFAQTMPDAVDRIRFLPAMENPRFLHLLAAADVMLDPLHFGGGNTSYEAFALGTPIVTLPGPYLRSRITFALYQRMGLPRDGVEALVAYSTRQYVDQATAIGCHPEFREALRQQILQHADCLYENDADVMDFAQCLEQML